MKKVKILWSGVTGQTGKLVQKVIPLREDVELYGGICRRSSSCFYSYEQIDVIEDSFDVLVDFSHPTCFDAILKLALKYKKPLVVGTSGLSDEQNVALQKASKIIPIFKGGNFRFLAKHFIDDVVMFAKNSLEEKILLEEIHYKSMHIPSQTALVIQKRVENEAKKKLVIKSFLQDESFTNEWRVQNISFRCLIYDENLVNNIMTIAKVMCTKKPDGIYDLDRLFQENNLN